MSTEPPTDRSTRTRGPVAWVRCRVLTDKHHWSQYLYWTPPIVAIGLAWLLLVFSWVCVKPARRLGGLFLRPVLFMLTLGCTLFALIRVWHLPRYNTRDNERAPGTIRVLHWNRAAKGIDQSAWGQRIRDLGADIVLIANASWGESRQMLLEQFEDSAPDDRLQWVNYSYRLHADPAHNRVEDSAMIAARFRMTGTGMVRFGTPRARRPSRTWRPKNPEPPVTMTCSLDQSMGEAAGMAGSVREGSNGTRAGMIVVGAWKGSPGTRAGVALQGPGGRWKGPDGARTRPTRG